MSDRPYLITRRRSFALLGSAGTGLLVAGTSGGFGSAFARTSDGEDYVGNAARACMLAPEQEEGPFYVALDRIREDIVGGQSGVPLELQITIINALTCKPLKQAAVDVWHCNASGVYSDIRSEGTVGETYLRGVQFSDKHGQARFKTIFPGHYAGRTTHIHLRVHISSEATGASLRGGHIAHTGQMFPPQAVYAEVYKLSPYDAETAALVTHAEDRVWTQQHGYEFQLNMRRAGHRLKKGLIADITMSVNPRATPKLIGASSGAGTTGGGPPPGGP